MYLQPSASKPTLPGAPPLVSSTTSGPGPYLWRVFLSWQVILAALIVFLANAFTGSQAGFLNPYLSSFSRRVSPMFMSLTKNRVQFCQLIHLRGVLELMYPTTACAGLQPTRQNL